MLGTQIIKFDCSLPLLATLHSTLHSTLVHLVNSNQTNHLFFLLFLSPDELLSCRFFSLFLLARLTGLGDRLDSELLEDEGFLDLFISIFFFSLTGLLLLDRLAGLGDRLESEPLDDDSFFDLDTLSLITFFSLTGLADELLLDDDL